MIKDALLELATRITAELAPDIKVSWGETMQWELTADKTTVFVHCDLDVDEEWMYQLCARAIYQARKALKETNGKV